MKRDRYMRDGRLVCGRTFGYFGRQCCGSDGDRCPECYEQDRVEQVESDYARLAVERDALRAELADIKETHESVMSEPCPGDDRVHCTCVPALRAELAEANQRAERAEKEAGELFKLLDRTLPNWNRYTQDVDLRADEWRILRDRITQARAEREESDK